MKRRGSGNPFHGRRHTDEWKRQASERQFTWTSDDLVALRRWYLDHEGVALDLDGLASKLGRPRTSVCRIAGQLGLTHKSRPTGRKPRAKYATIEESRAAISRAAKKRIAENGHPRGMAGKKQKPEVIARASAAAKAWRADATAEELSAVTDKAQATMLTRYGALSLGNSTRGNPYSRTKYGRRPDLNGQFFRSSWEANYARFLTLLVRQGIISKWEYEADTFWFEAIRRGVRSYTPDFKVTEPNGAVYYVEVKGWMDAKSQTKIARMAKYHPSVDLRVVGEKEYREITRNFGSVLDGWEAA